MPITLQLQGTCDPRFTAVREAFADVEGDVGFGYVLNQYQTGTLQNPDLRWPTLVEAVYASLGTQ